MDSDKKFSPNELVELCDKYADKIEKAKNEAAKVIQGQEKLISSVFRGFLCNGNILLEGLPGLGKTVLCRTMSEICSLKFKRVQFTTDLLPSDIIGIVTYHKDRGFEIIKGPIFCNLLLADEINRAPPKVQSALLEAMGEHQVTIGRETTLLDDPFLVLATQNPIEQSGTFPLPEAQVDRFMFKVNVTYPDQDSELSIIDNNLSSRKMEHFNLNSVLSSKELLILQKVRQEVHVETKLKQYALQIVSATRDPKYLKHGKLVKMGASPRASISLILAAKAQALMHGRSYVIPRDIRDTVYEVMRHRIYLNFKAKMQRITTDDILTEILDQTKIY